MSRERRLGLLLTALLLPLVVSVPVMGQTSADLIWQDGQEGQELRWSILHQNTGNGGTSSFSGNGSWEKFHSLDKASPNSTMYVEVWLAVTVQGTQDGEWTYSFEASIGEDWSGCQSNFVTRDPGTLGGSPVIYHSFPILCDSIVPNATEGQEFNWWVNRTATTGDPDVPEAQHLSIQLDRSDLVVYPMDLNITNLETYLPIVLFLVLVAWSLWNGWLLPALAATLGVIGSYMDIGVAEVGAMFLFLLFLWLQYYRDKVTMYQERGLK